MDETKRTQLQGSGDIKCPVCDGTGLNTQPSFLCAPCGGAGTISDRRRATPNDRAVERIKAELARYTSDLTTAQRSALYGMENFCNAIDRDDVLSIDAAIRRVRGEKE